MRTRGRPKGGYLPDTERKPALQRIKERHRLLAKFVAAGLTRNEIAARLDMTPERVGQLTLDPAMQNLIAQFRDHPHVVEMTGMDEIALLRSVSLQNALRSALALQDNLNYYEDADERMPVTSAAKIFELSADRIGFGKHSTNINVNVDFAAQLDRAIDRSRAVRTISVSPTTSGGVGPQLPSSEEGRGQGLRGDAPALSFTRRVPDRQLAAVAQTGEQGPCKAQVSGATPFGSTSSQRARSVQGNVIEASARSVIAGDHLPEPVKRRF